MKFLESSMSSHHISVESSYCTCEGGCFTEYDSLKTTNDINSSKA